MRFTQLYISLTVCCFTQLFMSPVVTQWTPDQQTTLLSNLLSIVPAVTTLAACILNGVQVFIQEVLYLANGSGGPCDVSMRSCGQDHSGDDNSYIKVNGVTYFSAPLSETHFEGFDMVTLDLHTCKASNYKHFDVCISGGENDNLANYINGLPTGTQILSVTHGTAAGCIIPWIMPNSYEALKSIGVDVLKLDISLEVKLIFHAVKGQPDKIVVKTKEPGTKCLDYNEIIPASTNACSTNGSLLGLVSFLGCTVNGILLSVVNGVINLAAGSSLCVLDPNTGFLMKIFNIVAGVLVAVQQTNLGVITG